MRRTGNSAMLTSTGNVVGAGKSITYFMACLSGAGISKNGPPGVIFALAEPNLRTTRDSGCVAALAVATVGNTLGGMSSYLIGRVIPQRAELKGLKWVQSYGSPVLLAAWVPILGDPLCVAAGWLRINPWLSALFMTIGKFARYLTIAAVIA